ncbi:methyltransferase [Camelimonas fluminis]|uniref:Class I SAM-dependent methyltransferase n=1 Tax=Camelimonas fluminis TaxID=1576911 RepID=A0ABV7UBC1_9HYPH|nr:class I SAM-dependent methyltransferase [Camelimonas fluminis]GHE64575.1 methyltransferase [Camelimonas fluminis]
MDSAPNAAQAEFWNTGAVRSWVELHEDLDRQYAPLSDQALAALQPAPGQRLLDVGCGCGANTLELATQAGPQGAAVGVDISAPMLARARELAAEQGVANASFVEADAQIADLSAGGAPFDGVFSRFGVMFFADPVAAFANIRRHMRPGATLAFICWRRPDENPVMLAPYRAALDVFPVKPPKADPLAPGPFAFSDARRIEGILADAGFGAIDIRPHDQKVGGLSFERALDQALRIGPLAGLLREQPEVADAARQRVAEALRRHEAADGVWLDAAVWVVSARAP